jgi:NADPH:quinone reductase-like Zn-dependent oxidoreductase
MKAMVYAEYGSPDVLEHREIEKPVVKDAEALVRVYASSINLLDWHFLTGDPFLARIMSGLFKPKHQVLGIDFSGRVEVVGASVTQFQPGNEVFGSTSNGCFAEYVCVSEEEVVSKPDNITFEDAAAVPGAAIPALQALRDYGQIQPGQKVLINGASGGVGTFAVQIAKSFGAEVTGVCSARNLDMVRSIGADQVIDYTREDFTQSGPRYDLIIDNVGNRSVSDLKRTLSPQGICVIIGYSSPGLLLQHMLLGTLVSMTGSKKIGLLGEAKPNKKDLVFTAELLEAGKVVPVIDRRYPLSETAEAIRYLEEGHARGKVIITVEHNHET